MYRRVKKAVLYFLERKRVTRREAFASHASFYALVSLVPMVMLTLMIAQRLLPEGVETAVSFIKSFLPEQILAYLPSDMLENAVSTNIPVISLTVLAMIWSSTKGIGALSGGILSVYGVQGEKNYLKRKLMELSFTVAILTLIVLSLVVLVFGETILHAFERWGGDYQKMVFVTVRLAPFAAFGLFTLAFCTIYKIISKEKAPFGAHLNGAAFAAGGWILYSAAFSFYLTNFMPAKYLLYGSFGALILLMLWVRALMTIVLLGAELNVYLINRTVSVHSESGNRCKED